MGGMSHWKNYFARMVVWLMQHFQGRGNKDHFLVVSTTGVGDTLWATPAIRALRDAHPHAYIGCLTTSLGATVLKDNPHLNEFFIYERLSSLLKLYIQLRKRKIGTVLLFHTSQRAILPLCSVIGAYHRIGTAGLQKGLDALLTQKISWAPLPHEIERRVAIARAAGAAPTSYDLEFTIQNSDRRLAKELLNTEGVIIGLHPGSKDRFKQWPQSHFVQVARELMQELNCKIVVTGSTHERSFVESLCKEIGQALPIIQPLHVMAAVLEKLALFITNDTGPLHLALAMKTPTLALFAPTNPAVCGPYQNTTSKVIQAPPTCFPCLKKRCRDPFCMRQISPDMVVQAALEQLKVPV